MDGVHVALCEDYNTQDDIPQGSATINLYLAAGQTVQVENSFSQAVYGTDSFYGYQSWFSGFLVFAM